jgi:hypothetical protein
MSEWVSERVSERASPHKLQSAHRPARSHNRITAVCHTPPSARAARRRRSPWLPSPPAPPWPCPRAAPPRTRPARHSTCRAQHTPHPAPRTPHPAPHSTPHVTARHSTPTHPRASDAAPAHRPTDPPLCTQLRSPSCSLSLSGDSQSQGGGISRGCGWAGGRATSSRGCVGREAPLLHLIEDVEGPLELAALLAGRDERAVLRRAHLQLQRAAQRQRLVVGCY